MLLLGLVLAAPSGAHVRRTASCVPATVAGKHACLKAGQKCKPALDRVYHRYRFHCHKGRLTKFVAAPVPAPPPTPKPQTPPPLPDPGPDAGKLVDVGGYRIMLECVGSGSPTVVMESGAGGTRWGVRQVQYAFASVARVCSYDRAGVPDSQSDPRPVAGPPPSATVARELHDALANNGEHGPYVLLGGSFGGILISDYALHYPDEVAGFIFVDAYGPNAAPTTHAQEWEWDGRADFTALAAMSFGSRPTVVLGSTFTGEGADIRRRTTNVIVAEATQYTHFLQDDAPGLVYEAVRLVVDAVRTGSTLPTCAASSIAPYVSRCD